MISTGKVQSYDSEVVITVYFHFWLLISDNEPGEKLRSRIENGLTAREEGDYTGRLRSKGGQPIQASCTCIMISQAKVDRANFKL